MPRAFGNREVAISPSMPTGTPPPRCYPSERLGEFSPRRGNPGKGGEAAAKLSARRRSAGRHHVTLVAISARVSCPPVRGSHGEPRRGFLDRLNQACVVIPVAQTAEQGTV